MKRTEGKKAKDRKHIENLFDIVSMNQKNKQKEPIIFGIKNMVCKTDLGTVGRINLGELYGNMKFGHYGAGSFGLFCRLNDPKVTLLVFGVGKVVVIGARDFWMILCGIYILCRTLDKCDVRMEKCKLSICNVVVDGRYEKCLNTGLMLSRYLKDPGAYPFEEYEISTSKENREKHNGENTRRVDVEGVNEEEEEEEEEEGNTTNNNGTVFSESSRTTALLYLMTKNGTYLAVLVFSGGFVIIMGAKSNNQILEIHRKLKKIFKEFETDERIGGDDPTSNGIFDFSGIPKIFKEIQARHCLPKSMMLRDPELQMLINCETSFHCSVLVVIGVFCKSFVEWSRNRKVYNLDRDLIEYFIHVRNKITRKEELIDKGGGGNGGGMNGRTEYKNTSWAFRGVMLREQDITKLRDYFEDHEGKHIVDDKGEGEHQHEKSKSPVSSTESKKKAGKRGRKDNTLLRSKSGVTFTKEYTMLLGHVFEKGPSNPRRRKNDYRGGAKKKAKKIPGSTTYVSSFHDIEDCENKEDEEEDYYEEEHNESDDEDIMNSVMGIGEEEEDAEEEQEEDSEERRMNLMIKKFSLENDDDDEGGGGGGGIKNQHESMRDKNKKVVKAMFQTIMEGPLKDMCGITRPIPYRSIKNRYVEDIGHYLYKCLVESNEKFYDQFNKEAKHFSVVQYSKKTLDSGPLRKKVVDNVLKFWFWFNEQVLSNEHKNYVFCNGLGPHEMLSISREESINGWKFRILKKDIS